MSQLKIGALLSYISMALHVLVGIVYVPLLLRFISVEEFGLYQLVGSLAAYLSVMDFGLSGTITRYYSQRLALADQRGQENVLAISLIIYATISALVCLVGVIFCGQVEILYGGTLSSREISSAKTMLAMLVANVAISIPANVFSSAVASHERFVFPKLVAIAQGLLQPFVVVAVLNSKAEAVSVVLVQVLFNVCAVAVNAWYAIARVRVRIRLHRFERSLVWSMFRFSFFVFLGAIVDQVYWKTGQLILGAVDGTAAVAVFAVAIMLDGYYIQFSSTLASVFLPRLSRLAALGDDMAEINALFGKTGRIQFAILGLVFTGFVLFGRAFIRLWAGAEFDDAYVMALVVMVSITIPLIQNVGILILQAKGMHAFRAVAYLVLAAVNVGISFPLARAYGGIGCAIATAVCQLVGNCIIMNFYYARRVGIDVVGFFRDILRMSVPVALSAAFGAVLLNFVPSVDWRSLVIGIGVYCAIYGASLWMLGLNEYEKGLLVTVCRVFRRGNVAAS